MRDPEAEEVTKLCLEPESWQLWNSTPSHFELPVCGPWMTPTGGVLKHTSIQGNLMGVEWGHEGTRAFCYKNMILRRSAICLVVTGG